ncbi:hypothetical protein [Tissierella sp.]|uniref:hypothetical protein n=1 Tax=Tissierella sp. TaxID=41274 RepID=UPI0028631695|nr:hypothetical protein [Tissierella sp.]MDR7856029.1 hypothetical protein [Tissierella sp.]
MKYRKITQEDVYKLLVGISVSVMNTFDCINIVNIASLLKTSRYQVKKYIDELKNQGMVELVCVDISSEDEPYPPYLGYVLTKKGRDTHFYREAEQKETELIKEIFG